MRKRIVLILALISLLALTGCGSRGERHTLEFTIPASFTDAFAFSDKALDYDTFIYSAEEISPTGKTLTLKAGAGYSSVPVILKVVECREENAYEPILLAHDKPVTINVEKGAWFQIGIALDNTSDVPIEASVIIENVEVRIANTNSWAMAAHFYLNGKGYFYNGELTYELPAGYEYVGEVINVGNTFSGSDFEGNVDGKVYMDESIEDTAYFSWAEWDEDVDGPAPFLKLELEDNQ